MFRIPRVLGVVGGAWGVLFWAPGFFALLAAASRGSEEATELVFFALAFQGPGVVGGLLGIVGGLVSNTRQRTGGRILLAGAVMGFVPIVIVVYDLYVVGSSLSTGLLLISGLMVLLPLSWAVLVLLGGLLALTGDKHANAVEAEAAKAPA